MYVSVYKTYYSNYREREREYSFSYEKRSFCIIENIALGHIERFALNLYSKWFRLMRK